MRMTRVTLALTLSLGATVALAQDAEVADPPPSFQPGAGEALVYFVRPHRVGGAISFFAFVDDQPIGVTRARDYTGGVVPAGERVVWSRSGNVAALKVDLEAGKTYYFDQEVRMGGLRARVALVQLDAAAGVEAMDGLEFKRLTEEGLERAREILAEDYEEAKSSAE